MSHSHSHTELSGKRMAVAIGLTISFVIGEAIAGVFAHSLALLSDAGHNFADALSLMLTAYAMWVARKPASTKQTFGYHRAGILTALVNAVALVVIALLIFWEAVDRLRSPEPVHGTVMIWVALVAVLLNAVIALWMRGDAGHDLNIRSAYLHMAGDAVSALGVVVAGVIIFATGSNHADPIVSILIGGFILWSSWGVLREAINVLMEACPEGLDVRAVERSIRALPGVKGVHDLHIWTVGARRICCSCHVQVSEQSIREGQQIIGEVNRALEHDFGISHATIQVEVDGCKPDEVPCAMLPAEVHQEREHRRKGEG